MIHRSRVIDPKVCIFLLDLHIKNEQGWKEKRKISKNN